mgnify:FL=1
MMIMDESFKFDQILFVGFEVKVDGLFSLQYCLVEVLIG